MTSSWRVALATIVLAAGMGVATNHGVRAAPTPTPYPGGTWEPGPEQYGLAEQRLHMVTMDDGVALRADVFFPTDVDTGEPAAGPFPVLLTQTPYSDGQGATNNILPAGEYFVRRGYIVVQADQRGRGLSGGGEWEFFGPRQGRDGANLVDWAAELPNSSGEVGLFGCSAMGISQLATAIHLGQTRGTDHPVKAMVPGCISGGLYRDTYFDNGIPGLIVPLTNLDAAKSGYRLPYLIAEGKQPRFQGAEVLSGGDMAYERAFWSERKWSDQGPAIVASGIPALIYVAWGEGGHIGGLELYANLQNAAAGRDPFAPMDAGQDVTGHYQLFIGEGVHGCCLGDRGVQLQWFDHWLKGEDTGLMLETETPMHLQVQADGRYINASSYPFTHDYTELRLGAGSLSEAAPADGTDSLAWGPPGPGVSEHSYETTPLEQGATIAGPITASIYASSTNTNLQLGAALFDVAPDGTATEITHGTVLGSLADLDESRSWSDVDGARMRPYPRFDFDRHRLPNSVHRYDINIAPKLYRIAPGHSLRLTLNSQWRADTCVASGGIGPAPYGCIHTAPQLRTLAGGLYTIHRSTAHPSTLNLPLLPLDHFEPVAAAPTPTSGGTVVPLDWGDS